MAQKFNQSLSHFFAVNDLTLTSNLGRFL